MPDLQFKIVDLLKFTEEVVDKQPTEAEIQQIVKNYVDTLHPSHIAIEVPLDNNTDFIIHGHTPAPLTVDQFTKTWIDAIHKAGINVYFRGTFCGIKNIYDFGFDKNTPVGTVDSASTDGKTTWLGRIYQWLTLHATEFKQGDIIGIIPESTNNAFNGNFFIPEQPNVQTNFLDFYTNLKQLCDAFFKYQAITPLKEGQQTRPVYTGLSSNVYNDIVSGWIPSLLFDLVGMITVDYYGEKHTPDELEKALTDLYNQFHLPIFLSEWCDITSNENINPDLLVNMQGFYEVFTRLKDQGILIGLNYFDGFSESEGLFTKDQVNQKGLFLSAFYSQGQQNEPEKTPEIIQPEPVALQTDIKKEEVKKKTRKPRTPKQMTNNVSIIQKVENETKKIVERVEGEDFSFKKSDIGLIIRIFIYVLIGADLSTITALLLHVDFGFWTAYATIAYTVLIGLLGAILDGK